MRANEDAMPLLALDISVQSRGHGGFRSLALALDQASLQCHLGNVPSGHQPPLQPEDVNSCALEDAAAAGGLPV